MCKSDFFQDRKCIYPNRLVFSVKPLCGSECKLYIVNFSKLRELYYFIFLNNIDLQVRISDAPADV